MDRGGTVSASFQPLNALSSSCCAGQVAGVRTSPCVPVYLVYTELEMDVALWIDGNCSEEICSSSLLSSLSSVI